MKIRLVALLILAGALAFACGPQPGSIDASASSLRTTPLRTISLAKPGDPARSVVKSASSALIREAVKLDTRFDVQVDARAVRFTLEVKNVGRKHVELSFPNGQAYDFVVFDSTGVEVWRWGEGRLFTQTVRNKGLGRGDAMHVEEKWSPSTMGGHYTVLATLRSTNYPIEQRVEFTVPAAVKVAAAR